MPPVHADHEGAKETHDTAAPGLDEPDNASQVVHLTDAAHAAIALNNPDRPKLCPSPIDLGNNLVMRRAEPSDRDELIKLLGDMHGHPVIFGRVVVEDFDPVPGAEHPTVDFSCHTVIVDTSKDNLIVSGCKSVPQVWTYGVPNASSLGATTPTVPLIVTRPESIETLPDYRNRGLVGEHMKVHHAWADALGSELQSIGGIPNYYRRFGYAVSPSRDAGRTGTLATFPPAVENDPISFRPATLSDVAFLTRVARLASAQRHGIASDASPAFWRNVLAGHAFGAYTQRLVYIIEAASDAPTTAPVGYVVMWHGGHVHQFELDAPENTNYISWADVTPSLLRWLPTFYTTVYLPRQAKINAPPAAPTPVVDGSEKSFTLPPNWSVTLKLGANHPCFQAVNEAWLPGTFRGFQWYTRIPSLVAFLKRVTPVLNHRLAANPSFHALTKSFAIMRSLQFLGGGTLIEIVRGKVADVSELPAITLAEYRSGGNPLASFVLLPDTLPTKMLTGYRTLAELRAEHGEVLADSVAVAVFGCLFPRMASDEIVGCD